MCVSKKTKQKKKTKHFAAINYCRWSKIVI